MRNPTPPRPQTKSSHHPVRFLYGGSRRNPSLTSQPRHPFRRRTELEAGHQNAAPPSGLGRNRGRGSGEARREEKPHLSGGRGASAPLQRRPNRAATPIRPPPRCSEISNRAGQRRGLFHPIFNRKKNGPAALASPGFASLGMFQISDAANGRGTNGSSGQSELTQVAIGPDGRTPTTERLREHASPVRLFPSV